MLVMAIIIVKDLSPHFQVYFSLFLLLLLPHSCQIFLSPSFSDVDHLRHKPPQLFLFTSTLPHPLP